MGEANEKLAQMADAAAKLQQQLVKVKRDKQKNKRGSTVGRRNKRKKKGDNKRSKFGAKKTDLMDDTYEIELTPTTKGESTAKRKKTTKHIKHKSGDGLFYYEEENTGRTS